ncbi:MAG: bifunctional RNase H/acid phosphatase [Pseudonocardiales bacterium]|nr:MAG: bifunctional RNase H/acid phosphatase [Pseudonocardiales bacterium]
MTGRRLIVEADGGSRGNPGPAGFGAVVRDARTDEVLAERSGAIGRATNNVAEYQGLIAGLQAAVESGGEDVEVRLDSKLLVEQMSGRWQVKHPDMKILARAATELVRQLGRVRFVWVPRARNAYADRLANQAMDAAAGVTRRAEASAAPNRLSGWMDEQAPPTVTILLRHGETPLSAEKRFSGSGDAALTESGMCQARSLAAYVARLATADAVVSSPLRRARQTADIVAAAIGLPVTEDPGFAETDFGQWEGLTFSEVRAKWPAEIEEWLGSTDMAPPGGESFAATAIRVRRARDGLLRRYPAGTVVVVSHVTPIKTLLRLALDAPPHALYRMHLDLAGVSEIDWYADGPAVVKRMNDTAHLHSA